MTEVPISYTYQPEDQEKVDNNFTYHAPKGGQNIKYERIRGIAKSLGEELHMLCPPSRERSLALTKLEESVMWANASIARNE